MLKRFAVRYRFTCIQYVDRELHDTLSACEYNAQQFNGRTKEPERGYTIEPVVCHADTLVVICVAANHHVAHLIVDALNRPDVESAEHLVDMKDIAASIHKVKERSVSSTEAKRIENNRALGRPDDYVDLLSGD